MYFALYSLVFEYPLEEVHWFGSETIEMVDKCLCLISIVMLINLRCIYGHFKSVIQLLYYVAPRGISL